MDKELIQRVKLGDEQAFELLFRQYYVRLCGFANKFLNNWTESEEIVQEVFLRIWNKKENLNASASLKSYLFKSVQNLCINSLDHKKIVDRYVQTTQWLYGSQGVLGDSVHESLLAKELEENIQNSIEQLPSECKTIFKLSRFDNLTYKEIAEKLNLSVKTVETQISRALSKLRLELKDYVQLLILVFLENLQ